MPENDSLPKTDCAETQSVHRIGAEQLRLWLNDRRNKAWRARRELLKLAEERRKEVDEIDALLAELIT